MEKTETLTFSENEILYLLIIAGADDEDIFERFDLLIADTTKEHLQEGRISLLDRTLISFPAGSDIPVINDVVIGLIGAIAVGRLEDGYYYEPQSGWRAKITKESEWYVIEGEEIESDSSDNPIIN